ncbi:MAG: hypothetical protein LAP40_01130 [Acidobacteriia bacterium]|nr:hypothetical protein [Terriglobia bacterium]
MARTYTESDFEQLSFHDCHIYALDLRTADADVGEWVSELALDIDYILEWICPIGAAAQFRVAPASLVFHNITDLSIGIDWGDSGFRTSLHPVSIDALEREPVADQKVHLDRRYYSWKVRLNWPRAGVIGFGATGFTLAPSGDGIVTGRQRLSIAERQRLRGAC